MAAKAEVKAEPLGQTIYLAAEGYLDELLVELGEVDLVEDRLVFAAGPPRPAAWAQNIWLDPVRISIASIGDGARALRGLQRNWARLPSPMGWWPLPRIGRRRPTGPISNYGKPLP